MSKSKSESNGSSNSVTKKRRGVHAKTKSSNTKSSRLYKKKYKGQGR
jgi:hypothetical protein